MPIPSKPIVKRVYVVVLAWNHWADTRECLDSLKQSLIESLQIVVVDNGSSDGTSERVRAEYPEVELIRLPKNIGISRGYNAGMQWALENQAKYILVMNNDTVADPHMLAELQTALETDTQAGAAIPKIVYYDNPRRIWSAGARWRKFPPGPKFIGLNELDAPRFSHLTEVEFATNCCIVIRADLLAKMGLFDPTYEFYYTDWDFTLRIRQNGYKILYVPQAILKHKVSVTTRKIDRSGYSRIQGRDSARFYLSHYSLGTLWSATVWIVLRFVLNGERNCVCPYLQGVQQGIAEMHQHKIDAGRQVCGT